MKMKRHMYALKFALVAVAVLAFVSQAHADVRIFLSTSNTSPTISAPTVELLPGETATLYIWVIPGQSGIVGQTGGIGLDVLNEESGIAAGTDAGAFGVGSRWLTPPAGTGDPVLGELVSGINVTSFFEPGINANNPADDPVTGAFLHAFVEFEALAVGSTDVFLQASHIGIATQGVDNLIFFGDEDEAVVGAPGARGSVADARIVVIPEPASLALLGMGGLLCLWRRRQAVA